MNTNSKNHPVFSYIAECVPSSEQILNDYGVQVDNTLAARLQWVCDTFISEYGYPNNLKMYRSYQNTFANWLMGLPSAFSVDYENYRIIELAKSWGSLPQDADDKAEDKILNNWFNFISAKFHKLCKRNKVSAW